MSQTDLRVVQSAIRCPYCHDDVPVAEGDWIVCGACLARHHRACWDERRRCAACSATEGLVSASPSPIDDPDELARLRLQRDLDELEAAWRKDCERYGWRPGDGEQLWRPPTGGLGVASGAGLGFLGFLMACVGAMTDPGLCAGGVAIIALGALLGLFIASSERQVATAFERRSGHRKALLDAIARVAPHTGGTDDLDRHVGREGREQPRPLPVLS